MPEKDEIHFDVVAHGSKLRVDENGRRNLRLVVGFRNPVREEADALCHLRRGQTDTVLLDHGTDHAPGEFDQASRAEPILRHGFSDRTEDRMAQTNDVEVLRIFNHGPQPQPEHPPVSQASLVGGEFGLSTVNPAPL